MRSFHMFRQPEPLREIKIAPDETGTAQRVSAEIAELAIRRTVAAGAGSGARIDARYKRIRVEPLDGSRLRDAGMDECSYSGTPGTTLAYCGPLPCTMPFPFAE